MFLQYLLIMIFSCALRWTEPCITDAASGHCYQIFDTMITWKNAYELCKQDGSNLVTIESVKEQKFIEDLMKKSTFKAVGLWIGSDNLHPAEQRAWANGEKFSYVNWAKGEPNSPVIVENCLEIYTENSWWNDAQCTKMNGYICENSGEVMNYIQDTNTGRWYKLVEAYINWDDALKLCVKDGGTLMIIETVEEQTFITDQIQHRMLEGRRLWLGSNNVHPEKTRTWTNGNKFTYVNWPEGEPNNARYIENCAEMNTINSKWNDVQCTFMRGYICEKTRLTEPCVEDETSGHCYQIFDTNITWKNAFDLCKYDGGNLVTIESVEEQTFIEDLMKKRKLHASGLWIGSDKLHSEEHVWANGEKNSYGNWAPGEPNNPPIDESCIHIYTFNATWNDERCTERNGYICENSHAGANYIENNNTGRWYKLVDKLITWDDAFNICDKDGGTLIIIESPEEQTFIADQIQHAMFTARKLWLGSNHVHPESERKWTNGKRFIYVNWANGEPNNSPYVENCAGIYTDNKMWNNRECTLLQGYICEKKPAITPYKLQEVYIIIITVGSALVIVVGVTILCCLLHKRNKCKKKEIEDYQNVQGVEMNQAEHEYNVNYDLIDTHCTIDESTPDNLTSRNEIY